MEHYNRATVQIQYLRNALERAQPFRRTIGCLLQRNAPGYEMGGARPKRELVANSESH